METGSGFQVTVSESNFLKERVQRVLEASFSDSADFGFGEVDQSFNIDSPREREPSPAPVEKDLRGRVIICRPRRTPVYGGKRDRFNAGAPYVPKKRRKKAAIPAVSEDSSNGSFGPSSPVVTQQGTPVAAQPSSPNKKWYLDIFTGTLTIVSKNGPKRHSS